MGLASARRHVEVCLQELIRAAGSERRRLRQARERLRSLQEFDPTLCVQAERLLTASIEQLDAASSGANDDAACSEVLDPLGERTLESAGSGHGDPDDEPGTTMTRPRGGT